MENYYVSNRDKFVTAFDKIRSTAVDYIAERSNSENANDISNEAAEIFEKILPKLPFIGGDLHPGTQFIVETGQWIALYKPMKQRDYQDVEIGQMIYALYEKQLQEMPKDELEKQKAQVYNSEYIKLLRQWTENPSPYEGDWKADFVEGDGKNFDYGLDYRKCALLDILTTHGAKQLAPFICLLDFPVAHHVNSGFFRTKTLAQGDDICNFRYKKGKEVVQNWDTEVETILSRQK